MITVMVDQQRDQVQAEMRSVKHKPSVMPAWSIWVGAGTVLAVAAVAMSLLFALYGAGTPTDKIRLEIVRLAGSIVIGTGGAAALLLAARRQRSTELGLIQTERDLAYKELAAVDARHDAIERRATELYAAAAEQLGSSKAPVRLAGLFALERFGQVNVEHRQTVIKLLCAYLRMPFPYGPRNPEKEAAANRSTEQLTGASNPENQKLDTQNEDVDQWREELQVRLTAQSILSDHLKPGPHKDPNTTSEKYWENASLNLSGAVLVDFNMADCHIGEANFDGAHFYGSSTFFRAHFLSLASFEEAHFHDVGFFEYATFHELAWFERARFHDNAQFQNAHFKTDAWFMDAHFQGQAWFLQTHFENVVQCQDSRFYDLAHFDGAHICDIGELFLDDARCLWDIERSDDGWPSGWTTKAPSPEDGHIDGLDGMWGFVIKADDHPKAHR